MIGTESERPDYWITKAPLCLINSVKRFIISFVANKTFLLMTYVKIDVNSDGFLFQMSK